MLLRTVSLGAVFAALVGAGVVAACSGDDGAAGPAGAMGATGATGPAGPSASADAGDSDAGTIAGMLQSCLSPCHGFNGVITQYQTSSHFLAYGEYAATEGETWTATGNACGNCHAIDALEQRVKKNVGTVDGGVVAHVESGELQYANNGKLATSTYQGNAVIAQVYCTTCHEVTDATDPHKTGIPWTKGSFPLRVSSTLASVNIEKSPDTTAVTGTQVTSSVNGTYGSGSTCMFCHRSRQDVTNYIGATNRVASVYWGPHEGPQADIFTGVGGYHFGSNSYAKSTHTNKLTCTTCHMVGVSGNADVPDHSFAANVTACTTCHEGAKSFNVAGGQDTIKAALTEIETWMNGQGWLTRNTAAPYVSLTTAQLGDGNWALDHPNPTAGALAALPKDQAGAVYNYILVARGGALGVHNPVYVKQLLWDSYKTLTGNSLVSIPSRPTQ